MARVKAALLLGALVLSACGDPSGQGGAGKVARIELIAYPSTLAVSDTGRVYAITYDMQGQEVRPGDGSYPMDHATLDVSPSDVVTMDQSYYIGKRRGTAAITVTIDGQQATVTITVAGFSHSSDVTSSETWLAADNPHYVRGLIHVGGPAPVTLTLEAGAQLRFGLFGGLVFDQPGATLSAVGTPSAPIVLAADSAKAVDGALVRGLWMGVLLSNSASELRNVVMSDCARDAILLPPDYPAACLVLAGLFNDQPRPVVQNLTIKDFQLLAVAALGGAGFGSGSSGLLITGGGQFEPFRAWGVPLAMTPNVVSTIPTGTVLGTNYNNRIILWPWSMASDSVVRDSQTWPALAPYEVHNRILVEGPNAPVLTLSPGVELQFYDRGTGLTVGGGGAGGLIAVGTAAAPVIFTSPDPIKSRESWDALLFGVNALPLSRLDHSVVEAAGNGNPTFFPNGDVVVMQNGLDSLITNSTIRTSGGCGILRAWTPAATNTDYTVPGLNNSFSDNLQGDQCGP